MGDSSNSIRRAIAARASRSKRTTPVAPVTPKPVATPPVAPKPVATPDAPLDKYNLPPVTVSAWIKSRPKSLKNVATRNSTPKMKVAIQRAKASRAQSAAKRLPSPPYLDEIIVLGERVRLNEIGINESTLKTASNSSELTLFSPSYFPGEKNISKVTQAKTVFSKVFAAGSKFGVNNPVPPCEVSEYNLLKEGLENRLYILRMNLPSTNEDIVSIETRYNYEKAEKFNLVIQAIETNEAICTNYELNFDTGAAKQIKGYGKQVSREDRERIQNLIRQFSFLVLQSINPVSGYENMEGNISPQFLIDALEQQQITKDDMNAYIAEYTEEANSEIPDLIAQTLEATGTQQDIYSLMLESELLNLITYVKQSVTDNLTDQQFKTKFTGFAKSIEMYPVREQITAIMKWILAEYSAHKQIISQNIDAINLNKSLTNNLQDSLADKSANILDLESKLAQSNAQLNQASQQINQLSIDLNKSKQDVVSSEILIAKGNRELAELLAVREGEKQKLQAEIDSLKASSLEALKKANDAKGTVGVLGSALDVVSNPGSLPLIQSVKKIAEGIKNGESSVDINLQFAELYNNFNQQYKEKNKLSDICYLNYFVSFFMKRIFKNENFYKNVDKFVTDYLSTHPESIDTIIAEFLNLLEAVENPSVKGVGYYTLSTKASNNLNEIVNLLTPEINAAAVNSLNKAFNKYYKKNVYYIPSETNGFIVRPAKVSEPPRVFNFTDNTFTPTDKTVPADIYNQVMFPYPTLFVLYIMFAKNYLVMVNPSDCPIPKFFTKPLNFRKKGIKFANAVAPLTAPAASPVALVAPLTPAASPAVAPAASPAAPPVLPPTN
jgi:hypothetical protein